MNLSTSTNLIAFRPDWVSFIPICESMKRIKQAGFDCVDLNLSDAGKSFYHLDKPNWLEWAHTVKELSSSLSLPITQTHAPFYNALQPNHPCVDMYESMIERSILVSGMMGHPWIVMHPGTAPLDDVNFTLSKQKNYEYFMPYIELAVKHDCGIAIENMASTRNHITYCSKAYQLCELIDSFKTDRVGVCWDFGHAHITGENQISELRLLANRLKATHVADNSGINDDHILPFLGSVDWRTILPILKEINYQGDLTYEIHNATSRLPMEFIDQMAVMSHDVGRYLLALANQ